MNTYLNNNNHKKFNINSDTIKNIKIIPNERKKLLQLADCCCSSLFQALKYNDKTHFEYIKKIKSKIYVVNNNILSYGLKIVPSNSNTKELIELINYLNN